MRSQAQKSVSSKDNRKHDEYQILQRRKETARMYVQGYTQTEIADKMGVTQATTSYDLAAIRAGWEASAILDWDKAKLKELAGLDRQEAELWKAWEKSLEMEVVETFNIKRELRTKTKGKGKDKEILSEEMTPTEDTAKKVRKQLIGDPRYMAEITKVRELRCKILGFLKDQKTEINNTLVINWDELAQPRVDVIEERLQLEAAKVTTTT